MNENPGETPNPLNPNPIDDSLDANPAEPVGQPLEEIVEEVQTISATTAPMGPAPSTTGAAMDPMARPMEQAPVAEAVTPPKKKKTGLIVGIVILVIALIGGGVAAALLLLSNNDPVAKAIDKIAKGAMPERMAIDGTINITPSDENSMFTGVEVTLNSKASTTSLLNSTSARLKATADGGNEISLGIEEIYADTGDLYLKFDGITNALEDYATMVQHEMVDVMEVETIEKDESAEDEVECIEDENGYCIEEETVTTDCVDEDCLELESTVTQSSDMIHMLVGMASIFETIDGEWLRIPTDLEQLASGTMDNNAVCMASFMGDLRNSSNTLTEVYNKNAFITSTKEGVTLASKSGQPVYRIVFDNEKLSSFINALQNSEMVKNLFSCAGYSGATIDASSLVSVVGTLPTLYVEVDKDYNFTRLYFSTDINEGTETLTVDLDLSYPDNIDVAEPVEYQDFSTVIQNLYSTTPEVEVEETTVVEE